MSKRPFGKILKPAKKQQTQSNQYQGSYQKQQILNTDNFEQKQSTSINKPTIGKLKLDLNKKKNIYDAIKKVDQQKQGNSKQGTIAGGPLKPTLNFKKNLNLNKNIPKQTTNQVINKPNNDEQLQQSTTIMTNEPKLTNNTRPTLNRPKGKLLLGGNKSKQVGQKALIVQKVIIQQQYNPLNEYMNNNRMGERQQMENNNLKQGNSKNNQRQQQAGEQTKKITKPNLFKNRLDKQATQGTPTNNNNKLLNNSQVYQQYNNKEESAKKQKFNFQKMMNIQSTQVNYLGAYNQGENNLDNKYPSNKQISNYKIQKQTKRANQLSTLLNLQPDIYEQIVSLSSTTTFQVYINKIKAGFLKNSSDQAFDQKLDDFCQTLSFESVDFSNQCPEDYQQAHQYNQYEENLQEKFNNFILEVAPIVQELIKPVRQIIMPPISLLAFHPIFVSFKCCPNPVFLYYSEKYNISLLVSGQKLYITEDQVSSVFDMGGIKIGGLKNGKIVLWNGENNRGSKIYNQIQELIQSQNFQLPSYTTNDLDRLSPYICQGEIIDLLKGEKQNEFYSLDSAGKMIKWVIQIGSSNGSGGSTRNKKYILVPEQLTQFSKLLQKRYLNAYSFKQRAQNLYLNTSSGLLIYSLSSSSITQKLSSSFEKVKQFYLPKRSNLIFCLMQYGDVGMGEVIKILNTQYQGYCQQIRLGDFIGNNKGKDIKKVQELIIPEIQHENREISIFYCIYVVCKDGDIYQLKINNVDKSNSQQNQSNNLSVVECYKLETSNQSKKAKSKKLIQGQNQLQNRSKRSISGINSNILFTGVNVLPFSRQIQRIKLYKDLKAQTQKLFMRINLQKNVNNLKMILTKNKNFISKLMGQDNVIMV